MDIFSFLSDDEDEEEGVFDWKEVYTRAEESDRQVKYKLRYVYLEGPLGDFYQVFESIELKCGATASDLKKAKKRLKRVFKDILERGSINRLKAVRDVVIECWNVKLNDFSLVASQLITNAEKSRALKWAYEYQELLNKRIKEKEDEAEHNSLLNRVKRALGLQQSNGFTKMEVV